ncbi:MAG TPA: ATP phosphoribosyltransferase regulatory subunit [Candidatus Merdenecus merdavium]|nr:ATP phosphoribosyltransferase regulatory subunit [Candidatus Merdenecus merdavium]
MSKKLLHTPEGVRDIYNSQCEKKMVLEQGLHQVLKSYGYHDIESPTIEYFDVFSSEVGTISSKELYKFFDREGDTLVLRPDLTPSIARFVSTAYRNEDMPLRLCYKGKTFVNYSSYQGRLKETTQLGAELIGEDSKSGDGEMIALVVDLLLASGLQDFQISIGHVDFFKSLIEEAGIEEDGEDRLRDLISNKNMFGVEEILQNFDVSEEIKSLFLKLPQMVGDLTMLDEIKASITSHRVKMSIIRLQEVYRVLSFYGYEKYIAFDLSMLNKYKYYTGIVFRAYTFATGDAIVKGGRYDKLLSYFGKDAPSIGFTVVIDELLAALMNQNIEIPIDQNNTLILYESEEEEFAIGLAKHFRETGLKVELMVANPEKTLDNYIAFAKRNPIGGILYVQSKDEVQVMNVKTGETVTTDIASMMG